MKHLMLNAKAPAGKMAMELMLFCLLLLLSFFLVKPVYANNLHDHLRRLSASELAPAVHENSGIKAPGIHGQTLNKKAFDYSGGSDKPLVLMFADSLCPLPHFPNCQQEIAEFNRLARKYADKLDWLQVVKGYYVDEAHVKRYIERFAITAPSIWDRKNKIFTDYQVFANPYVVVINRRGEIVFRKDDFSAELESQLLTLLN
ncbi:TlpA family protein disulfide reductase [Thalassomonas actiniarum]|uniref:TlpA family protein disulfide reductase n=1 Tax=Thalassomonas actiniarum TaxID=485447 RepID=A0AAE9YMR4_9GAMM|nr:TlpA disulfide reductase family protein [Thalassomonas actiniarum]WDD98030.1 TlpA family protein disulfide reductase [Thalassomonas actiniarum]